MLPINNNNEPGCNPISSNCVIWQGPDIPCLSLCKGDTVSDVVFKLATEFCTVIDETLNISSYNLSCFNLNVCQPNDFIKLIQFLITRICALEQCTGCIPDCNGVSTAPVPIDPQCCDTEMLIYPCLQHIDPVTGQTILSMTLKDYVEYIGKYICDLVQQLINQGAIINNNVGRLDALEDAVEILETAPPPTFPTVTSVCVIPGTGIAVEDLLEALEIAFCQLRDATGYPNIIYTNILKQPLGIENDPRLDGSGGTLGSTSGWSNPVTNMAQSVGNLWLTIQDLRTAIKNIQLNCCPSGCDGIEISLFATLAGSTLTIFINGTVPAGFTDCSAPGTIFTITDSLGNSTQVTFAIVPYIGGPSGYMVDLGPTPVNPALDLTISATPCLTNVSTGATCEFCTEYYYVNTSSCPAILITSTDTTISYTFSTTSGLKSYAVELWNGAGTLLLTTNIHSTAIVEVIAGSFTLLTPASSYKVRLVITPDGGSATPCPFTPISTSPQDCPPPEAVQAEIQLIS